MIVVHILPSGFGLPSVSPFCLKLLTWLRMAELEHEVRVANLRQAPRGKVPWVELDGEVIPDSERIIENLTARFDVDLDAWLDAQQRAQGHAIRRMIEEHTYFTLVWDRWVDEDRWRTALEPEIRKLVPPALAWLLPGVIRKSVRKQLHQQGIARHDRATIMAKSLADLDTVEAALGANSYLLGSQPSTADASVYSVLASMAYGPCSPELKARVTDSRLGPYCQRIRERYWARG